MNKNNIAAIYPLSSTQQGILYHSLYGQEAAIYCNQLFLTLAGPLDAAVLHEVWRQMVACHDTLRTLFMWERDDRPLQVVLQRANLPWQEQDWRDLPPQEQQQKLTDFLEQDAEAGFDLTKAPLMRLTLIRLASERYQLVWSSHHILLDGWSTSLLLQEMLSRYKASVQGRAADWPAAPAYKHFVTWQKTQDLVAAARFWQRSLQGFTVPTPLPVGQYAVPMPDGPRRPGEQRLRLSSQATADLQALARQHRLTLNTIVQGAWALLLSRYGGEKDVLFGVVTSGRPADLPGAERMIGLLINTLPLRAQIEPQAALITWLQHLQAHQLEIRQYEYAPLVEIQGWSEVPRHSELFNSIFAFENYPVDDALHQTNGGLCLEGIQSIERTNYPLSLVVGLAGAELSLKILYDPYQLTADTVARLQANLAHLLQGIAAHPERKLKELSFVAPIEREQTLVTLNSTAVALPGDVCVQQLFEAQAAQTPGALALSTETEQWTYRTLNERANQLAHYLRCLGVGPESLVGLYLERSPLFVLAALATLKAGGAYVPLDPALPSERLAFILTDSQATILLTQQELIDNVPPMVTHVLPLDRHWDDLVAQQSWTNPSGITIPANLAYVIYTSGSTGQPKGVQLSHRNLLNLIRWHQRVYHVAADDAATLLAGLAFDASVWETWPYLTVGATLHIPPEDIRMSPDDLLAWLRDKGITITFLVTPLAEAILSQPLPAGLRLRHLLTGGETLHTIPTQPLPFRLINNYGPTESTVVATWVPVIAEHSPSAPPPIGRPIDNIQVYLLDERLEPVPIGAPGMLYIGGVGLSRGYLNQPGLTAEMFIPHPFSQEPGARLYHTGDLARYRSDGNVEFIGRIDFQVKIHGFRIELGEIEAALKQHPAVYECAVLAHEVGAGENQLVAYVVAAEPPSFNVSQIKAYLTKKLPSYMIPTVFVPLEAMPLTPNGKTDRRALPRPDRMALATQNFVAPRTVVEEAISCMWADLLELERVGVYDDFFELGGHSLLATRLFSRVRKAFRVNLSLRALFEATTIADQTALIVSHEVRPGQTEKVAAALKQIQLMSAAEVRQTLQEKREKVMGHA